MPIGLLITAWSWLRSSKIAMYVVLAGILIAAVLLWRRGLIKEGEGRALQRAAEAAAKRMERNREIHRDLQTWPLDKRAERLRKLNARG